MGSLSTHLSWTDASTKWASQLNPVIANVGQLAAIPLLQGKQISGIILVASTPLAIAHGLGSVPTGWFLVDVNAQATVWRTAWTNQTITLESSANATISIWVY